MSKKIGDKGEEKALLFLKSNDFIILDCNFHSRFGEIDIVAKKGGILHFVEVKYSKKYEPIYRITSEKIIKIVKTVEYYMYKHKQNCDFVIDAVLVTDEKVELVENITM